jgi:hypothetical protein
LTTYIVSLTSPAASLANVPFPIEGKSREDFIMAQHQPVVLDAFGIHHAELKIEKWS